MAGLAAVIVAMVVLLRRRFLVISFDQELARLRYRRTVHALALATLLEVMFSGAGRAHSKIAPLSDARRLIRAVEVFVT